MAKRTPVSEIPVTRGSGNVYADLGFANPAEELAKAQLASLLDEVIRERGLTQLAAATLMGADPADGISTCVAPCRTRSYQ